MDNFEKIFVFGAKGCKFCSLQKEHLNKTFGKNNWTYIDLKEDKGALDIALDIKIENIPTVVVFDNNFHEIHRKEGILSPDKIFEALYGEKVLPIDNCLLNYVKKGQTDTVLLSYEPKFQIGEIIKLLTYMGEIVSKAKINSIIKVSVDYIQKKYGSKEKVDYLNKGGRKDWAWAINFDLIKKDNSIL